jgi:hypothetical protein
MDAETELALRAILRGLFHAEAISADHIRAVGMSLKDAAGAAMDRHEPVAAKKLLALAKGIKTDTAVI